MGHTIKELFVFIVRVREVGDSMSFCRNLSIFSPFFINFV